MFRATAVLLPLASACFPLLPHASPCLLLRAFPRLPTLPHACPCFQLLPPSAFPCFSTPAHVASPSSPLNNIPLQAFQVSTVHLLRTKRQISNAGRLTFFKQRVAGRTTANAIIGSMRDDSALNHDYKGRPRMASSQHGMVATDQGNCSAMGMQKLMGACCIYVTVRLCLPACVSVCLPVCPSACLSVCLSVCLSAHRPVCLSVCLSACLSVCLPVCVSVCATFVPPLSLCSIIKIWLALP